MVKRTDRAGRRPKFVPKKFLIAAFLCFCVLGGAAIALFDNFRYASAPIHMPLHLVSHFGELRPEHFHLGLDISTNGKENVSLYATSDGYIKRVRIEAGNTGNCLFVQRADGTIAVYGHLNRFFDDLDAYVRRKQYREHSWTQDFSLTADQFPVKRGDLLGYSGNTGHSEAPHLHFEVRDAVSGKNIDPHAPGIEATDHTPPTLKSIFWYDRTCSVYATQRQLIQQSAGSDESHPIQVYASVVGLGLTAVDRIDDHHHSDGVARAEVFEDNKEVFSFSLDSLTESEGRCINGTIDYPYWLATGKFVQYLFRLRGNHLSFINGRGNIALQDGKVHKILVRYGDAEGNMADVTLFMQYVYRPHSQSRYSSLPKWVPGRPYTTAINDLRIAFPADAFYDTVPVVIHRVSSKSFAASATYQIGDAAVPLHDSFTMALRSTLAQQSYLRYRTVIELLSNGERRVVKGRWYGDWMTGKLCAFGTVRLLVDTIPPSIAPDGWTDHQRFTDEQAVIFTCNDDNGLARVSATLDGHWILLSQKDDVYSYAFDEYCSPGKHKLVMRATDLAGNTTARTFYFRKQ